MAGMLHNALRPQPGERLAPAPGDNHQDFAHRIGGDIPIAGRIASFFPAVELINRHYADKNLASRFSGERNRPALSAWRPAPR